MFKHNTSSYVYKFEMMLDISSNKEYSVEKYIVYHIDDYKESVHFFLNVIEKGDINHKPHTHTHIYI